MSASLPTSPRDGRSRSGIGNLLVQLAVALVALAYAGGHLGWYRDTPLGQVPMLDEQENLMLG
jgi:hypothetical protein